MFVFSLFVLVQYFGKYFMSGRFIDLHSFIYCAFFVMSLDITERKSLVSWYLIHNCFLMASVLLDAGNFPPLLGNVICLARSEV